MQTDWVQSNLFNASYRITAMANFNGLFYVYSRFPGIGSALSLSALDSSSLYSPWTSLSPKYSDIQDEIAQVIRAGTQYIFLGRTGGVYRAANPAGTGAVKSADVGSNPDVVTDNEHTILATGDSGCSISKDNGTSWSSCMLPSPGGKLMYGNGRFVAIKSAQSYPFAANIFISLDGVSWKAINNNLTTIPNMSRAKFIGGYYYIIRENVVYYSDNLASWKSISTNAVGLSDIIAWSFPNYAYSGLSSAGLKFPSAAFSNNGVANLDIDFISYPEISGTTQDLKSITYGKGLFVAVGNGATILVSTDGTNWANEVASIDSKYNLTGVAYNKDTGTFVVAANGGMTLRSTDGIHWTSTIHGGNSYTSIIYKNGKFIATGTTGIDYSVDDGSTWKSATTISMTGGITYVQDQNMFYAVSGIDKTVMRSTDGITWSPITIRTVGSPIGNAIVYNPYNNAILIANNNGTGTIYNDMDSRDAANFSDITGLGYSNGVFFGFINNGQIKIGTGPWLRNYANIKPGAVFRAIASSN